MLAPGQDHVGQLGQLLVEHLVHLVARAAEHREPDRTLGEPLGDPPRHRVLEPIRADPGAGRVAHPDHVQGLRTRADLPLARSLPDLVGQPPAAAASQLHLDAEHHEGTDDDRGRHGEDAAAGHGPGP